MLERWASVVACAALCAACGSGSGTAGAGGDGPGASSGGASSGGADGSDAAGASACDDYYEAVLGCMHPTVPLPAAEMTRLKPRWEESCTSEVALPGSGANEAWLEGCATAIHAEGCLVVTLPGGPCTPPTGTLGASAACNDDTQCQSGICEGSAGSASTGCGTCTAPDAPGQACQVGLGCSSPDVCDEPINTTSQQCMAVVHGAAGSDCDTGAYQCEPGLTCSSTSGTCVTPGAAGAPCTTDADCAAPLGCPTVQGASTCRAPGQAGDACGDDTNCVDGLGCDENAFVCATIAWASAGQACSGSVRCLVGECPFANGTVGGTCPAVVSDGAACGAKDQCDAFAACLAGTCQLAAGAGCH